MVFREFVELLNTGAAPVDLSGWSLHDASALRHVFPAGTLLSPLHYLVVFGGGSPQLPGITWQIASTGGLSLNNTAETVTLFDTSNGIVAQVIFGSLANNDQSIVRSPEGSGAFALHAALADAEGRLFSPGTNIRGELPEDPIGSTAVPEPSTLAYFLLSGLTLLRRKS